MAPPTRHLFGWLAFLAVAVAAQLWVVAGRARHDPEGYLFGDSGVYAAAAHSLLHDGDLDLLNQVYADRPTLQDALPELEGTHGSEFGLSKNGALTIKQSPVLAAAAVPFYALLGRPGFLVFNLVVLNVLLVLTARLAGGTPAARVAVLVGFLTTPLFGFSFNFSPDLFLCALLVGSLLAARSGRPGLSGVLAGVAVSTKVYVAVLVLPVPVVVAATADRRWVALGRFAAGGALGLAPGLAFNTWLFGAPWVTGYERELHVEGGRVGVADHSSRFNTPPLAGLRGLVFHPALGLWPTAPVWFLWPAAAAVLLTPRFAPPTGRTWVVAAVVLIGLNLGLFAVYDGALEGSVGGNRYLFPALLAGLALMAAAAGEFCGRSRLRLSR